MTYLIIKILVLSIIAALLLLRLCAESKKPSKMTAAARKAVASIKGRFLPFLQWCAYLHSRMEISVSARKLYVMLLILVLLAVQFTELSIAEYHCSINPAYRYERMPFFLAFSIVITLWFHKYAHGILSVIHGDRNSFIAVAVVSLALLFLLPQYMVLSETLALVLLAALFYPEDNGI